jgi:hypothetical protein
MVNREDRAALVHFLQDALRGHGVSTGQTEGREGGRGRQYLREHGVVFHGRLAHVEDALWVTRTCVSTGQTEREGGRKRKKREGADREGGRKKTVPV